MKHHRHVAVVLLCLAASCGGEKPSPGNPIATSSAPGAAPVSAAAPAANVAELPPITPVKATAVLTAVEVSSAFGGAVFKTTEERNDPPVGYSSISGCQYVEEGVPELDKRYVVVTVRSHGVEKDTASFLKSRLELDRESGVPIEVVADLGEDAFISHRSAMQGGSRIEFRRGKDYFELVYRAFKNSEKDATSALLKGLARATLEPAPGSADQP